MNVSDLEFPRSKARPSPTWLRPGLGSLVELDPIETGQRSANGSRGESKPAAAAFSVASFTPEEIRSFQNDDAMATGMIGAILGLAFLFLLTLVVGVSVWMLMV